MCVDAYTAKRALISVLFVFVVAVVIVVIPQPQQPEQQSESFRKAPLRARFAMYTQAKRMHVCEREKEKDRERVRE